DIPAFQGLRVEAVFDKPVDGDGEGVGQTRTLAGRGSDFRLDRPAAALHADEAGVAGDGGGVGERRVRIELHIGAAGLDGQRAGRRVIVVLHLYRSETGFLVQAIPFENDLFLIGAGAG